MPSSKSDFGQRLLHDLRMRKEKVAPIQTSSSGHAIRSNGGSRLTSNSNQIVLYRNGKDSDHMVVNFVDRLSYGKANTVVGRLDYGFSQVHISQIWKGVQKLNQILKLKARSNGFNLDRDTILVGQELLRGAIDLEESLRLLVNLQEGSNHELKRRSNVKLVQEDDDDDGDRAANSQVSRPRFSFDDLSRNSSHGNVIVPYRKYDENRDEREKGRMSNVLMKLMGLEELPQNTKKIETRRDYSANKMDKRVHGNVKKPVKTNEEKTSQITSQGAQKKANKQPFLERRGTRNGETLSRDKALQVVKRSEISVNKSKQIQKQSFTCRNESKKESLVSQKAKKSAPKNGNQRSKLLQGVNHQTDKKKKAFPQVNQATVNFVASPKIKPRIEETRQMEKNTPSKALIMRQHLTKEEKELKEVVIKSQLFLNTAEALFSLGIPIIFLHASHDKDEPGDKKLALNSAFEVMKRKVRKCEATLHPYKTIATLIMSKFRSLDDLVRELCKDMDMLKYYGRTERDEHDVAAFLHKMVERDINVKDSDINCMWDHEWNSCGWTYSRNEDIVSEVEQYLISGLINEIIDHLVLALTFSI